MYRDQYKQHALDPSTLKRHGAPPPMVPSAPFAGHSSYKDEFKGWKLPARRPALGLQMVGDRTFILIRADAPLPATGRQVCCTHEGM